MKKILYFLNIVLLVLIYSCSSTKEYSRDNYNFAGYSEIDKGDTATLKWNIPESDEIYIQDMSKRFNSRDSLQVSPVLDKIYNFQVIKGKDTSELSWVVKVIDTVIKTGPDTEFMAEWLPSYTESEYLIGRLGKSVNANPKQIKVMNYDNNIKKNDNLTLNFILLDEFGNFIPDYFKNRKSIFINSQCKNNTLQYSSTSINENHNQNKELKINLNIENSYAAGDSEPVDKHINDFLSVMEAEDMIKINYFNQNSEMIVDYSHPLKASENLLIGNIPLPTGLNGMYKNTYKEMKTLPAGNNLFVLINFSPDNSSIVYNANDLINAAESRDLPVYIISIGYAVNTFNLKYITNKTGGRFYNIASGEIEHLSNILKEIYYSHKSYYSIDLNIKKSDVNNCSEITNIVYIEGDESLSDEFELITRDKAQYTDYQSVASFEYKQTSVSESFTDNIKELASVLAENPNAAIQLTGHSSIEGDEDYNKDISLKRAQEIRKLLLFYEADPSQIRVVSEGSSLPVLFYAAEAMAAVLQ
jgi:outer membrane protein OmpA-like peptidoglycan-associated protein